MYCTVFRLFLLFEFGSIRLDQEKEEKEEEEPDGHRPMSRFRAQAYVAALQ